MSKEDETLMHLNPKSDFERYLLERNKTIAQAEHIKALIDDRAKVRKELEELKNSFAANPKKAHIFNLQNIIADKNKTITEQGQRFKKLKTAHDILLQKLIELQTKKSTS